ncbi:MAG: ferrous iron transporter B, partial [Spirochaetales bacterium]|nr:ferrous iron transporter B [Spirochaetales bacterium]
LKSFDFHFNLVTDSHSSILATIAGLLVPVMRPIGLGDWRLITSLVSGFLAKEGVVSMIGMLFRAEGGINTVITPLVASSMLVFSLLYTPCIAAVASIRREMGRKWALGVVLWQCSVAWLCALIVRLIGLAFGMV